MSGMASGRTVHPLGDGGAITDWLIGPAWHSPCDDLDTVVAASGSPWGPPSEGRWSLTQGPEVAPLKSRLYERHPLVVDQPLPELLEGAPVSWVAPGAARIDAGEWARVHTPRDGLVDWSEFCFVPEYRHAIAGTVLEVDQPEWRTIEVSSTGPIAIWVDGRHSGTFTDVSYMEPVSHRIRVRLGSGETPLLIATWQVAFREVRHVARVAIHGLPVRVVIPSPGADERASAIAEAVLESVSVESWATPAGVVRLRGPRGAALRVSVPGRPDVAVNLGDGQAELSLASTPDAHGEEPDAHGEESASMLRTGETTLAVRVDDDRCPVVRSLPVALLPTSVRAHPVGSDPALWRREVLEHAAAMGPSVARALAALDTGGALRSDDLASALSMVNGRADCADFEAVGLLNLWHALPDEAAWPTGARDAVRSALLGFKYWIDQPGLDAMCYFTENHQLVFHTAELLAGEAFPEDRFSNTGWSGAQHLGHARPMVLDWIRAKLRGGFSEFDSNAYLAIDTLALTSLTELSSDVEIREAAEVLLDKMLFSLAANSWHGIHGAAHGRSYVTTLRSSRFEETGPIMWALWGAGTLNSATLPATALARSRRYQLPGLIRAVATDFESPWWGRQVYAGAYSFELDLLSRPYGSDVRVWKTTDAMLSSAQDYRSGLPGLQEHVWGATLGPEVQVFATYPPSMSSSPSARPNAWAGQRVLPRARQHRDTVLAIYPDRAPLATHVWFPTPFMDETVERGGWLAGRVGSGYVAVNAAGGFEAVHAGETAGQEWFPRGSGNAFVATVGSRAEDGSFEDFVRALAEPTFAAPEEGVGVTWIARDGRRLALVGNRSFTVDGVAVDLGPDGRPETDVHLDNPAVSMRFGDDVLEAEYRGHRLVLDIDGARRKVATAWAEGDGRHAG